MASAVKTPSQTYRYLYSVGDIVYHRLATERCKGLITGLYVRSDGLGYWVTWADRCETQHYEFELSTEYVPDYAAETE